MPLPRRVRARMAVTSRPIPPPLPVSSRARGLGWPLFAAAGSLAGVLALLLAGTAWILANSPEFKSNGGAGQKIANSTEPDPQKAPAPNFEERPVQPNAVPLAGAARRVAERDSAIVDAVAEQNDTDKHLATVPPSPIPSTKEIHIGVAPAVDCNNFGTAVAFLPDPTQAARQAATEHKLVFVLHISGNFEDDRFT